MKLTEATDLQRYLAVNADRHAAALLPGLHNDALVAAILRQVDENCKNAQKTRQKRETRHERLLSITYYRPGYVCRGAASDASGPGGVR